MAVTGRGTRLADTYPRTLSVPGSGPVVMMQEKLGESGKAAKAQDKVKEEAKLANPYALNDAGEFVRNMVRVGQQSQKLLSDFFKRQSAQGKEPVDPLNLAAPFMALVKAMTANPSAIVDAQFQLWRDFLGLWEVTARKIWVAKPIPWSRPALATSASRTRTGRKTRSSISSNSPTC
jgi:hypothetical protein